MRIIDARLPARPVLVVFAAGFLASPAVAQVALDGTANPAFRGALEGPDYAIAPELGRTEGANLFHSFERFGLRAGESATFSGPGSIANVISRVTGGERSDIDGALRSTIPGADLWFLNPAGVVFGPNATLDVRGSFHVSTADELRFSDGAVFSATDPATGSTFTVAAPEAFGFLGAAPAGLVVDRSFLSVPAGEAFSLVGGDVAVTAGNNGAIVGDGDGVVRAEAGRVTLAALGGPGGVRIADGAVTADAFADIRLTDEALVDAAGDGGGTVRVRGGRFVMDNLSFVFADNTGPTDARGGIDVEAEAVAIGSGSQVTADVFGSGRGPELTIRAGEVTVAGSSGIFTSRIGNFTYGAGRAGDVTVTAGELEVRDTARIVSTTFAEGDGGMVTVAAERVRIVGEGTPTAFVTGITSRTEVDELNPVPPDSVTGDAGAVTVTAAELELRGGGGAISSSTFTAGDGGTVTVEADRLLISRGDDSGIFVGITSQANADSAGDAGTVTVRAGELELRGAGEINSATLPGSTGRAGEVTVEANRLQVLGDETRIDSATDFGSTGAAGSVTVNAPVILLADGGTIASSSDGTGVGGSVTIRARDTFRSTGGVVTAQAAAANAGDVEIEAGRLIDLEDSEVTTSAAGGQGSGGNILIDPEFVVLDGSRIVARAREGAGGNIRIVADNLIASPDNVIDASSDFGVDGDVQVDAPDQDVTGGLVALPTAFVDVSSLLPESCAARSAGGAQGSFVGVGRGGVPPGPQDLLAGSYAGLIDAGTGAAAAAEAPPRFEPVGLVMACGDRRR